MNMKKNMIFIGILLVSMVLVTAVTTITDTSTNTPELNSTNLTVTGAISGATIDTGQGANELYAMNQDVETSDAVTFSSITDGTLSITGGDITGADDVNGTSAYFTNLFQGGNAVADVSGFTMGGNIALNGNYLSGDGGNEGVFVDSSGDVGIGTASPSATLDVVGNTELNGKLTITGIITTGNGLLLTPTGGNITIISSYHTITTEGGTATDNVSCIHGGTEGDLLYIRTSGSANDVTFLDADCSLNTANINNVGNANYELNDPRDIFKCIHTLYGWTCEGLDV